MIDGDCGGDFDVIGELITSMGNIMGAKAQMLTQPLEGKNGKKDAGQIVVRAEAVQESNECATFHLQWRNVNNMQAGCMGMCPEQVPT